VCAFCCRWAPWAPSAVLVIVIAIATSAIRPAEAASKRRRTNHPQ
jgi:hypothetical protein